MAIQGRFIPKNPQKYVGNPNRIIFRSTWELHFFKWLDKTDAILRWGSEELAIPYVNPIDRRVHRYYPDCLVWYKDVNGQLKKEIIEIKPYKETVRTPRMTERDAMAITINEAKWAAAANFANTHGATFRVLTEKTLFRQGPAKQVGRATL